MFGQFHLVSLQIYKPSDEDYDQFWIDFNTGSKRVSLFIEPNFLQV